MMKSAAAENLPEPASSARGGTQAEGALLRRRPSHEDQHSRKKPERRIIDFDVDGEGPRRWIDRSSRPEIGALHLLVQPVSEYKGHPISPGDAVEGGFARRRERNREAKSIHVLKPKKRHGSGPDGRAHQASFFHLAICDDAVKGRKDSEIGKVCLAGGETGLIESRLAFCRLKLLRSGQALGNYHQEPLDFDLVLRKTDARLLRDRLQFGCLKLNEKVPLLNAVAPSDFHPLHMGLNFREDRDLADRMEVAQRGIPLVLCLLNGGRNAHLGWRGHLCGPLRGRRPGPRRFPEDRSNNECERNDRDRDQEPRSPSGHRASRRFENRAICAISRKAVQAVRTLLKMGSHPGVFL